MKKILSLAVCLLMMVGLLASCGDASSSSSAASTSAAGSSSSVAAGGESESSGAESDGTESSDAIRWTGGVVGNGEAVVAIMPTLQAESVVEWSNVWAEEMTAAGYSPTVVSAETTVENYVTLIEDYTQQGVVGIFTAPMDADAIQDAVTTAMDQGIVVIFLGEASDAYDPSGGVNTDYYWTGYGAVKLAEDWLQNEATLDTSSPVSVAINTYYDIGNGARRSECYKDALDESSLLSLAYEQAFYTSASEGYEFAQNAMTADPNTRVFICYEADTARGVDEFLMNEYLPAHPELSATDFLTVSAYYDAAAVETVDLAENNPGDTTFRAYITYGAGNTETGWALGYVHLSLLSGEREAPYWYYDSVNSRTSWGGTGTYTWEADL